jgi:hypothetical protein
MARFAVLLLLLSAAGAWLLWRPGMTEADQRDWQFYATRQAWLSAFDGVSAACGAGLLHADFDRGYGQAGRWTLTGVGFAGALAFVLAAAGVARRLIGDEGRRRVPGPGAIAGALAAWQLGTIAIALLAERAAGSDTTASDVVMRAVAAFSSLGWWPGLPPKDGTVWLYAGIGLAGGLGWPIWLLGTLRPGRSPTWRTMAALLAGYATLMLIGAGLIAALEVPRSQVHATGERTASAGGALAGRFDRAMAQSILASTAALPVEGWTEETTDGSRFVLACLVTAGALPGSAGGGVRMTAFLLVVVGIWRLRPAPPSTPQTTSAAQRDSSDRGESPPVDSAARKMRLVRLVGAHYSAVVWLLLAGALGLLVIQNFAASPYQAARTFADALLDSASAVAGGGLTSGMAAELIDPSLSSGMHSPVDRYQYGAAWLMLLMLAGRIVPLWLLARAARRGAADVPAPVA